MTITSYAQNFEDIMLWRALGHVERGFYIDLGAQDPVVDSVSLAFYEKGWRGVHVEPNAAYAEQLRKARPDETIIEAAVAKGQEKIEFFVIADTGLSTGDATIATHHEEAGFSVRKTEVTAIPLREIFDEHGNQEIHWLKIDVEGMEASVIESWLPSPARPWIVVVESTEPMTNTTTKNAWEPLLLALGYEFVYFDGLNRFYLSKNHPELRQYFDAPPNLFDDAVFSETLCSPLFASIMKVRNALTHSTIELNGIKLQRAAQIREIEALAKQRDALITANQQQAAQLSELAGVVNQRDELMAVNSELKAHNETISRELGDAKKEKASFNATLAESQRTQSVMTAELKTLSEHVSSLQVNVQLLRSKLEEIRSSTSWRLTAPLRFVGGGLKWFGRATIAWVSLKPGTRPRRIARRTVISMARRTYAAPGARKFLGALLRVAPPLRRRVKKLVSAEYKSNDFRTGRQGRVLGNKRAAQLHDSVELSSHIRPVGDSTIYYFVNHTIGCPVNTGVQRVTRGLASGLGVSGRDVIFVKWDAEQRVCVLLNIDERQNLAKWNGPSLTEREASLYPAAGAPSNSFRLNDVVDSGWLIVPEVPHIAGDNAPSTLDVILWAKKQKLQTGFVFYDAIPLRRAEFSQSAPAHAEYMRHLLLADAVWPISEWSGGDLVSFWADSEKAQASTMPPMRAVHLPADTGIAYRQRQTGFVERLILCVGTVEPRKNQIALIRAFQRFCKKNPNTEWSLVLVGNLHPLVAKEIQAARSDQIKYFGNMSDEDLADLYTNCAFTVFPSVEEGFGLPILESLWFAKPCICADFGAMGEVAAGGGCFAIDVRDESALEHALTLLISDEALREKLANEAVARRLEGWNEYAANILNEIKTTAPSNKSLGPIFYWVDSTCTVQVNTGIQRVVRQTARSLIEWGLELIPVVWGGEEHVFAPASERDLEHLEKWNGPSRYDWSQWRDTTDARGGWFVMGELPLHFSPAQQTALMRHAKQCGLKSAAIFYDAIPAKLDDIYPPQYATAHKDYMRRMSKYDVVLAISQFSHDDLLNFLKTECRGVRGLERKIVALPLAGEFSRSARVTSLAPSAKADEVTILCVGTVEPRKNHKLLLEAFALAKGKANTQLKLIIAGRADVLDPELGPTIQKLVSEEPDIEWIKETDDVELCALYAAADFTVYPSYEEGFGLPILESLWNAKPCVCANFGAMAEVAEEGGGCHAVDVLNVHALAEGILKLSDDFQYRNILQQQAVTREFKTWREYGKEFIENLTGAGRVSNDVDSFPTPEEIKSRARQMNLVDDN